MRWKLDKSRPICPQICEHISVLISKGELKPNEKLMSVREVAVAAGVNPNTVQKAFEQLAQSDLIYSVRNSGWFVKESKGKAAETVLNLRKEKTMEYLKEMKLLGFDINETIEYLKKEWDK